MGGAEACPLALVVPGKGQGHLNGAMLLARSLAAQGFEVTFIYFSTYYAKLKASERLVLPYVASYTEEGQERSSQSSGIVGSSGDGVAADMPSHSASGRPGFIDVRVVEDAIEPDDRDRSFFFTPSMKENLYNLILQLRAQGRPPTCLISDTFVPWTNNVAERAGIPRIDFWTSNAMSYLFITNLPPLIDRGIFPEKGSPQEWKPATPLLLDHIPGMLPFPSELFPKEMRFLDPSTPMMTAFCQMSVVAKHAERVLLHTIAELEPDAFQALELAGVPAYAIGPLLQYTKASEEGVPAPSSQAKGTPLSKQVEYISWLNRQADLSVIYVAFGSFGSLPVELLQELAFGLEASGSPFLWVVREDSLGGAELQQVLPDGFLKRTSAKGMIISWAAQVEVLAHKAIGGFLTHCGWNSTLESLWAGVPLLCCPLFAEQRSNSRYICDAWGVGLELERTDTGALERRGVEVGVRCLIQEDEGLKARRKAQEMMKLARKACERGGQSYGNLQKFYEDMKVLSSKSSSDTCS